MGAHKGYNASRCALELLEATGHGERVKALDAKVAKVRQGTRRISSLCSMVADAEWVTRDELDARLQEKDAQFAALKKETSDGLEQKDAQITALRTEMPSFQTEMTSFREEMIALATGQAVAITKLKAANAQYQAFVANVDGLI